MIKEGGGVMIGWKVGKKEGMMTQESNLSYTTLNN